MRIENTLVTYVNIQKTIFFFLISFLHERTADLRPLVMFKVRGRPLFYPFRTLDHFPLISIWKPPLHQLTMIGWFFFSHIFIFYPKTRDRARVTFSLCQFASIVCEIVVCLCFCFSFALLWLIFAPRISRKCYKQITIIITMLLFFSSTDNDNNANCMFAQHFVFARYVKQNRKMNRISLSLL